MTRDRLKATIATLAATQILASLAAAVAFSKDWTHMGQALALGSAAVGAVLLALWLKRLASVSAQDPEFLMALQEFADPFIIVDRKLRLRGWNSQIFPILRLMPDEMLNRESLRNLPLDAELIEACAEAVSKGRSRSLTYRRTSQAAATERYYTVNVRRLGADWFLSFHDITEFKLAEQQRLDFVANVSHELRTPLTSISGYSQTLIADLDAGRPVEKRFLETIQRNTDRLLILTTDLLDLAKLDAKGSVAIEDRKEVDVQKLTDDVLEELEPVRKSKSQEITAEVRTPRMMGSRKYLFRILRNLCQNASRYSPPQSRIHIRWENVKNGVELRVNDNGPGIPIEHQARLFERFYRVDSGRSDLDGGSGLGLAIVKHAVLVHGGSVRVESEPGRGSTFICFFPQ